MDSKTAKLLIEKYSTRHYDRLDAVAQRAEGSFICDPEGNLIFDGLGGYSSILWGHGWPVARDALMRAVADPQCQLDLVSNVIYTVPYAEFCETICLFTGFDRVFPKSNGGSVVESALNALKRHGRRQGIEHPEILIRKGAFHGRGNLAQNFYVGDPTGYPKLVPVEYTVQAVAAAINKNTVGFLREPYLGEGGPVFDKVGMYTAINKYLRGLKQKIWIIDDEIQTGLDRCGDILASKKFGDQYRPDGVLLGKSLGAGVVPIAVFLGTDDLMDVITPGSDGETYGGFPIACSVATAGLKYLAQNRLDKRACEIGKRFADNLASIPFVEVEYEGALIGIKVLGSKSTGPLCRKALSGDNGRPRFLMKDGHVYDDGAHTRIACPIGSTTLEMIDEHCHKTLRPLFIEEAEMIDASRSKRRAVAPT